MKRYRVTVTAYAYEILGAHLQPADEDVEEAERDLFVMELEAESAEQAAQIASRLPTEPMGDIQKKLEEHMPIIQAAGAKLGESMADQIAEKIVGRLRTARRHQPVFKTGDADGG